MPPTEMISWHSRGALRASSRIRSNTDGFRDPDRGQQSLKIRKSMAVPAG